MFGLAFKVLKSNILNSDCTLLELDMGPINVFGGYLAQYSDKFGRSLGEYSDTFGRFFTQSMWPHCLLCFVLVLDARV